MNSRAEKCETKGLFIPQGGNVHRFVTQCYILSIKIFPTSKMTSCHKEPQHNGNLEEQNSIWLQLHYLVTNSFVFWWKLQISRKSWEIFPKIWNVGTQQKWCTFKHMQFKVHYAVADTYTVFENHPKCRIWVFQFWHFPPIFVLLKRVW